MYFVYIIRSLALPDKIYIGQTNHLSNRLKRHNGGSVPSTKSLRPWEIIWSTEKNNRSDAMKLEKYLKSLSYSRKIDFIKKYSL